MKLNKLLWKIALMLKVGHAHISFNNILCHFCIKSANLIFAVIYWWRVSMEFKKDIGFKMVTYELLASNSTWKISLTAWSTWQTMQCKKNVRTMENMSQATNSLFLISKDILTQTTITYKVGQSLNFGNKLILRWKS